MIVVFHGDDLSLSRNALVEYIGRYPPHSVFNLSEDPSLSKTITMGSSEGFLSEEKLLVFEIFKEKAQGEKTSFLNNHKFWEFLKEKPSTSHLAFWFEKVLPKNSPHLNNFSQVGAKIVAFTKPPKENLFPLLSRIFAGDKSSSLLGVRRIIEAGESFYLLSMLGWKIRQLLGYFYDGNPLPKGFTGSRLLRLYRRVFEMDLDSKSGRIDINLNLFRFVDEITDGA